MSCHGIPASEGLSALGAYKGCGYKVGVMIAAKVHVQQLFLPKGLLTLAAGIWLLPSMCALVHDHVTLLAACIVTLITLEAFLIFVGFLMLDKSVALVEHSITVTALSALFNVGMLLTEMHTKITLAGNDGVAVRAVKFRHIFCVLLQNVHLHGATLGKPCMTDIALIGLLS